MYCVLYNRIESPYNFEFTILSIAEIKLIPKLCCYFDSMTGHHIYNELTQIFESTISGDTYRDQLLFQGKIDKQIYLMVQFTNNCFQFILDHII